MSYVMKQVLTRGLDICGLELVSVGPTVWLQEPPTVQLPYGDS